MDQHGLTVPESAQHENVEKCRDIGFADTGRLVKIQSLGNSHRVARVGYCMGRVAAAAHQGHDPLADLESGHAGPKGIDGTGDFQAKDGRFARRWRVVAHALDAVRPIDSGGRHPDAQLPRGRFRRFRLADVKHLGAAKFPLQYRLHWTSQVRGPGQRIAIGRAGDPVAPLNRIGVTMNRNS